jgi:hypothetical protein
MDYIFVIKNYNNKYDSISTFKDFIYEDNFTIFEYFILSFYLYLINIEQYLLNEQVRLIFNLKQKKSLNLIILNSIINIINYFKFFLLIFEGFQYSNEMRFIYNFYYIIEENNDFNLIKIMI